MTTAASAPAGISRRSQSPVRGRAGSACWTRAHITRSKPAPGSGVSAWSTRLNVSRRSVHAIRQLPQAAISLKQGAGRLIRTETDRGVLMLCDPRLVDKPYGRRIWQSLPPMKRTRELADVIAFFGADKPAQESTAR